jgi:hypothetical protein
MDSDLLFAELKSHGIKSLGPILPQTNTIYFQLLSGLRIKAKEEEQREEQQQQPEEEKEPQQPEKVFSKELQNFVDNYPGPKDDIKKAKDLDRELVEYFKSLGPDSFIIIHLFIHLFSGRTWGGPN